MNKGIAIAGMWLAVAWMVTSGNIEDTSHVFGVAGIATILVGIFG